MRAHDSASYARMLRSLAMIACAIGLAIAAATVMFTYGASWRSVIVGCALFALAVHVAEPGIGSYLYPDCDLERPAEPIGAPLHEGPVSNS